MDRKLLLFAALAVLASGWFTRAAWRARQDLVTLEVRDQPVAKVVRQMERQTWETIVLADGVEGVVTLNIKDAPLLTALNLVAQQMQARGQEYFVLSFKGDAAQRFARHLGAGTNAPLNLWTNLAGGRGFGGPGGPGGFGGFGGGTPFGGRGGPGEAGEADATNAPVRGAGVTLELAGTPLYEAARRVGRAARAQVVPEDGLVQPVTLSLSAAPPRDAVTQLAAASRTKQARLYALTGAGRPPVGLRENVSPEDMQARMAARLAQMSDEERARLEALRSMTPEERQAQMAERLADPAMGQRMAEQMSASLRASTPQQRVESYRRGGPGGFGGRGGPGGGFGGPPGQGGPPGDAPPR